MGGGGVGVYFHIIMGYKVMNCSTVYAFCLWLWSSQGILYSNQPLLVWLHVQIQMHNMCRSRKYCPIWIRCMMPCFVARQQLNEYIWNPLLSENNWLLSTIVIGSCTAVHCTAVVQELKNLQGYVVPIIQLL